MLRFYVFDQSEARPEWSLKESFLVGKGGSVLVGTPIWKKGVVECASKLREPYGLALRWKVSESQSYLLQTCLLAPREKPYVLSLELARHRIKVFLDKCESWQMFSLDDAHPAMKSWEKAREIFVEAIAARDEIESDRLATKSLLLGIEATDHLAIAHADILFRKRYRDSSASIGTLGVQINHNDRGENLEKIIGGFDLGSIATDFLSYMNDKKNNREYKLDQWIKVLLGRKKVIVSGPLLSLDKNIISDSHLNLIKKDFNKFQDIIYDYGEFLVQRYKGKVKVWTITSGLESCDFLDRSQRLEVIRMLSVLVRQNDPSAKIMVEINNPWGEYKKNHSGLLMPVEEIEWLRQEGVKFHFVGIRFDFGESSCNFVQRDFLIVSDLLDQFHHSGIPLILSSVTCPSEYINNKWNTAYSSKYQSLLAQRFLILALSKPSVKTFIWGALSDSTIEGDNTFGLVSKSGMNRQSLFKILKLRRMLDRPLKNLKNK